jgi:hypothetical protein
METISISGKETKKHIAEALKAVFPGFRFGLTSDFDSVRISWVDGPLAQDVQKVLNRFESYTRVLSVTDFERATGYEWKGSVYVGAKYLNTSRQLSEERRTTIVTFMDELDGNSYIEAKVYERVAAERELIATGTLEGVSIGERPDLVREEKPQSDERPKKVIDAQPSVVQSLSKASSRVDHSFLKKRDDQISAAKSSDKPLLTDGDSVGVIKSFPVKTATEALKEALTPEQWLKLMVLQNLFNFDFAKQTDMSVDEAFVFLASELYHEGNGR